MKNTLNEILDKCSAEELDILLKDIEMPIPDEISSDKLCKNILRKSAEKPRKNHKKIFLLAACFAMLTAAITGGFVIADAVEYNNALKYCNENNIPIEGLSREDIKNVYRNITVDRYAYSVENDTVKRDIVRNSVSGYNISIRNSNDNNIRYDDSDIKDIYVLSEWKNAEIDDYSWDSNQTLQTDEKQDGSRYSYIDIKSTTIKKMKNDTECWSTTFRDGFRIERKLNLTDGNILVYGNTGYAFNEKLPLTYSYNGKTLYSYIVLINDENGEVIWKKTSQSDYSYDTVKDVVQNKDGSITAFSLAYNFEDYENSRFIHIRTFNIDGEMISSYEINRNETVNIMKVCAMENGWVLRVIDKDGVKLLKINQNGELTNTFFYQSDYEKYDFSDCIEFDGKMYISAVVRKERKYSADTKSLETLTESGGLLDDLREEYTSVLLVCDLNNGEPQEFYSIKGSMPCELSVNADGQLVWKVNRIISAVISDKDFYSIEGIQRKYVYTFNKSGLLESAEKTDILSKYYV